MARQERTLLQRIWVQFPGPTWPLTAIHNSSSRKSSVLILAGTRQVHGVQTDMQAKQKPEILKEVQGEPWQCTSPSCGESLLVLVLSSVYMFLNSLVLRGSTRITFAFDMNKYR